MRIINKTRLLELGFYCCNPMFLFILNSLVCRLFYFSVVLMLNSININFVSAIDLEVIHISGESSIFRVGLQFYSLDYKYKKNKI